MLSATGKQSYRKVATRWGIPIGTLHRLVKNKTGSAPSIGGPTVLTKADEDDLVASVLRWADRGLALSHAQVKHFALEIVKRRGYADGTVEGCCAFRQAVARQWIATGGPSPKWFRTFMKRHPHLSSRVADKLDPNRFRVCNTTLNIVV